MNNIFIEGLQGMGKSTLLQKLSEKYPSYHVIGKEIIAP